MGYTGQACRPSSGLVVSRDRQWQREGEGRSSSDLALDPDFSTVKFDEFARDRETKSGAFHLPRRRSDLTEFLEHRLLIFGGNSHSGVDNGDLCRAVVNNGPDIDSPALRRELQRVREQVE